MKKLILFAAIGACCVIHAASFNWGSTDTVNALNAVEGGYVSEGTVYYLFAVGSETGAITSFDSSAKTIKIGENTYSKVDQHTINSTDYGLGTFSESYEASASVINQNYYVVLFDSGTAENAGSGLISVSGITETGTPPDYTAALDATGIGTTANMVIPVTGGTGVPEPTSGLLLLVGGAMLALRRKRA